jgi:hypothetical protein
MLFTIMYDTYIEPTLLRVWTMKSDIWPYAHIWFRIVNSVGYHGFINTSIVACDSSIL